MLVFQMCSTASMQWKILHLLVCFEVNRDDFSVTSIFGHPIICLILVTDWPLNLKEALSTILRRTPMESMTLSKKQDTIGISNLLKQFAQGELFA